MWKATHVAKERSYYNNVDLRDIALDEAKKELDRLDEYEGVDDSFLRNFAFSLNLSDDDTAKLLNYGAVVKPGLISLISTILMCILLVYNIPMEIYYLLLCNLTSFRIDYKNKQRPTSTDRVILQTLNAFVSTAIYILIYLIIKK